MRFGFLIVKISMTKVFLGYYFVAAIFLVSTACDFSNPWDYSHPAHIAYTISGGFGGIHVQTTIDENGQAELSHRYYPQKFVVHYELTPVQLDSLKDAFDQADFIALRRKYEPKHPIADGFFYAISYTSDGATKTVEVEDGADYPKKLNVLLSELHRVNGMILENPDSGTLLIYQSFAIHIWPFSEAIKLGDHSGERIYFNNTEQYRQIFNYLDQLDRQVSLYEIVFWEGDSLFTLGLSRQGPTFEENIGSYFQVWGIPIRYWPMEFGFALSDIPETGRVLTALNYKLVRRLLNDYRVYPQLFIFDELRDGGKAVTLVLVSGRPENI